jgi:hypothetical protein
MLLKAKCVAVPKQHALKILPYFSNSLFELDKTYIVKLLSNRLQMLEVSADHFY